VRQSRELMHQMARTASEKPSVSEALAGPES
jgi:hypothetical protein